MIAQGHCVMGGSKMARVKIKELRLKHFKAFADARLVLDDKLTVIIGRNSTGKSTLLDAFEFMRGALADSLRAATERRGGIGSLRQQSSAPYDVSIAIVLEINGQEVLYGFKLGTKYPNAMYVKDERLVTADNSSWFYRSSEEIRTSVKGIAPVVQPSSLLLPLAAGVDATWQVALDNLSSIRAYNLSVDAIGSEPEIGSATALTQTGSNAGDVLKNLTETTKEEDWIVQQLRHITPGIEAVKVVDSKAGRRYIEFTQRTNGRTNTFVAKHMSDGTLRSLGIMLALRQRPTPPLVLIDEVEDSVHPAALGVILGAIADSVDQTQVIITSHNTDLLERNIISAAYVRVVEWEEGVSSIHNLSENMIKAIDGPYEDVLQPGQAPFSVGELLRYNGLHAADAPELVGRGFFEVTR
jgi:predicted ATPase